MASICTYYGHQIFLVVRKYDLIQLTAHTNYTLKQWDTQVKLI